MGRSYCRRCFQKKPHLEAMLTKAADYYQKRTIEWLDEHGDGRDRPADLTEDD